MEDILNVAAWFLSKESMTHKKLQKICYYAQAWHCALYNRPLVADEFQAWVHGPVSPALYSRYADYGWQLIPKAKYTGPMLTKDTKEFLETVLRTYKRYDGDDLEAMTHEEFPWQNARKGLEPLDISTNVISTRDMHDYYLKLYQDTQND